MFSPPEQIDTAIRFLVVYAVVSILFVLNTVALTLPTSGEIEIPLISMIIYYWSIYRPTLLPPWMVFMMGIIFDSLSGLPLGLNAFIFLGLRWLVVDQRLFLMGQSFVMVWVGFGVVSILTCMIQWFLFGLLHFQWTPLAPVGLMILAGIFMFPVVSIFLHFSHKILPLQSDHYNVVIK